MGFWGVVLAVVVGNAYYKIACIILDEILKK